ncbi:unnamed protein product [Rotaria sp. Silwood1]|nr:unnamed protein product [Rotaria sp. Silwood1]
MLMLSTDGKPIIKLKQTRSNIMAFLVEIPPPVREHVNTLCYPDYGICHVWYDILKFDPNALTFTDNYLNEMKYPHSFYRYPRDLTAHHTGSVTHGRTRKLPIGASNAQVPFMEDMDDPSADENEIDNSKLNFSIRHIPTTKSSLSPNISSFSMSSKDNPNRDSSDIQTQITNEQIKNLFTDNAILQKQLESKTLSAVEERIEKDDSLHSNQQQNQQFQTNEQTSEFNEEQLPDLNDNHSNALDEKPSLLDFFRDHISPFSGHENAYQWFIQLDSTFSNLKLSFDECLKILPYFFVGRSMIWYSLNKHKINCYTDFCQLFTLEYINTKQIPDSHISSQCSNRHSLINSQVINNKDFIDKPTDHSGNITIPLTHHHISSTDSNNSTLSHSISSTISKALIDKFVKDPIKFYGGKDSVINWLDEIEQQFHNMQLCESDKLNLIQICLKGDAQQCYRQNKKYFTSWSQFVTEIKKSYHSNLQRDIAFKKLQQYHQTPHQSVF